MSHVTTMTNALYLEGWLNYYGFEALAPGDARNADYAGVLTPQAARRLVEYQRPAFRHSVDASYRPGEPILIVAEATGHVFQGSTALLAVAQGKTSYRCLVRLDPRPASAPGAKPGAYSPMPPAAA